MPEKVNRGRKNWGLLFLGQDGDDGEVNVSTCDLVGPLGELEILIPHLMAETAPHHESPPAGKRPRCRSRVGKGSSQFRDGRLSVRR